VVKHRQDTLISALWSRCQVITPPSSKYIRTPHCSFKPVCLGSTMPEASGPFSVAQGGKTRSHLYCSAASLPRGATRSMHVDVGAGLRAIKDRFASLYILRFAQRYHLTNNGSRVLIFTVFSRRFSMPLPCTGSHLFPVR
jgi:hypothetical protein